MQNSCQWLLSRRLGNTWCAIGLSACGNRISFCFLYVLFSSFIFLFPLNMLNQRPQESKTWRSTYKMLSAGRHQRDWRGHRSKCFLFFFCSMLIYSPQKGIKCDEPMKGMHKFVWMNIIMHVKSMRKPVLKVSCSACYTHNLLHAVLCEVNTVWWCTLLETCGVEDAVFYGRGRGRGDDMQCRKGPLKLSVWTYLCPSTSFLAHVCILRL